MQKQMARRGTSNTCTFASMLSLKSDSAQYNNALFLPRIKSRVEVSSHGPLQAERTGAICAIARRGEWQGGSSNKAKARSWLRGARKKSRTRRPIVHRPCSPLLTGPSLSVHLPRIAGRPHCSVCETILPENFSREKPVFLDATSHRSVFCSDPLDRRRQLRSMKRTRARLWHAERPIAQHPTESLTPLRKAINPGSLPKGLRSETSVEETVLDKPK
jgi:hypothetical protein